MNKYFSGCFNSSIPPLSSLFPAFCQSSLPPTYLCTQSQVLSLIANLPLDSASGPDFISTRMLKHTAHSIVSPLTHFLNLSLSLGRVPSDWKNSFIVPIPKSSSNTSDPSNYRPISLLSVISKILEKHVHSILYSFCLDHNLVSPYQFGFLPNRSTSSALLFATNSFHKILQNNKAICACFLDLKKAFDSVPHAPLIDLLSSLNCPPLLLKWLYSYLSSRSQQVVLNGSSSSPLPVLSGVPQGSILGPLLFLIYINGITSVPLSPSSTLILYADDILIFRPIVNELDFSTFQNDLNSVSLWLSSNFLSLNSSKSKYMFLFYRRSIFIDLLPPLCLSGSPLELVTEFKYLGVTLSSSLSWSSHISNICAKARKLLSLLYRQFYFYSDTSTLLHLYISLIRPHLEYCSFLFDSHSSHLSSKIEKVQYFLVKFAAKIGLLIIPLFFLNFIYLLFTLVVKMQN